MKKHVLILLALVSCCLSAYADNITKSYDLTFTGLEVSNNFDIRLVKADSYQVTVEVDSEYAPYLSVTTESGILKVGFKKLPVKMKMGKERFKLTVHTPLVNYLNLSGSCKLTCTDTFDLGMNNFRATITGASTVNTLKVNTIDASVLVSGASKVFIDGEFGDLEVNLQGASKLTVNGSCSDLDAEVLASSELTLTGRLGSADLEIKGASKVNLTGQGTSLEAEVSGASKLTASEFPVSTAKVEAKGASTVLVNATESLKADIQGASTCKYVDNPDLRLNPMVKGGGTFKTL